MCACGRGPKASSATVCRQCARVHANGSYRRRRGENPGHRYGISVEEYQTIFDSQNGKCAICESVLDVELNGSHYDGIHIDHSHEEDLVGLSRSKAVRGILCPLCNRLLGYIERAVKMGLVVRSENLDQYLSRRPVQEMRKIKT